ncbi:SpoIIE family protein phosphatase [Streptomyces sp. NPDC051987]|uniref:SpoIIE family protein phosphatase n=1 Tax=Streptomyces sp. NPDC051987 TaxID=3155808 RepID=UPI00344A4A27
MTGSGEHVGRARERLTALLVEASTGALGAAGGHVAGVYLRSGTPGLLRLATLVGLPGPLFRPWWRLHVDRPFPVADAYRLGVRVVLPNATEMVRRYPQFAAGLPFQFGSVYTPVPGAEPSFGVLTVLFPGTPDTVDELPGLDRLHRLAETLGAGLRGLVAVEGDAAVAWEGDPVCVRPPSTRPEAGAVARVARFTWDPATSAVRPDDRLHALLGMAPRDFPRTGAELATAVTPDDADDGDDMLAVLHRTAAGKPPHAPLRVRATDGTPLLLELWPPPGAAEPSLVSGIVIDMGPATVADGAADPLPQGVFCLDRSGVLRYANPAAVRLLGRPRTELLGRPLWEAVPWLSGPPYDDHWRGALLASGPVHFQVRRGDTPDSDFLALSVHPGPDQIACTITPADQTPQTMHLPPPPASATEAGTAAGGGTAAERGTTAESGTTAGARTAAGADMATGADRTAEPGTPTEPGRRAAADTAARTRTTTEPGAPAEPGATAEPGAAAGARTTTTPGAPAGAGTAAGTGAAVGADTTAEPGTPAETSTTAESGMAAGAVPAAGAGTAAGAGAAAGAGSVGGVGGSSLAPLYRPIALAIALTDAVTARQVSAVVTQELLPAFGGGRLAIYLLQDRHLYLAWENGFPPGFLAPFDGVGLDAPIPGVETLTTGRPLFFESMRKLAETYPGLALDADVGARAFLPLIASGRPVGTCILGFDVERGFSTEERTVLTALAGLIAHAMEKARRYDSEAALARGLQQALLPRRLSAHPQVETVGRYLPGTQGMDVGGDWYDVVGAGDGLALVIGDVQGHGVQAAATMGQLRSAVRAFALSDRPPDEVLSGTNRLLIDLDPGQFASCCYLRLDPATGRSRIARAGHLPPLLCAPDGRTRVLELPGGVVLGVDPRARYPVTELELAPDAILALYTDGLVERPGADIDEGIAALGAVLAEAGAAPGRRGARTLTGVADRLTAMARHATDRPDDVALLLATRRPGPADRG